MTSRLDEKETDSYLQTVEANTLADPKADVQDEPSSQDDEGVYESPWPPLEPSGRKEVPKLGEVEMLSSKTVQALFDGIMMGTNGHAEREWDQSIIIDREEDDINLGVRAARLTTPKHVINWAKAQKEDTELGAAIAWLKMDFPKESSWAKCLTKLKQLMGPVKETPDGRVVLRTADKLTLSGGVLYQRHRLEDTQDVIKQFVIPQAHCWKVIDSCHRDMGHQGHDQTWTLVEGRFWWPRAREDFIQAVKNCNRLTPMKVNIHRHLWCQLLLLLH